MAPPKKMLINGIKEFTIIYSSCVHARTQNPVTHCKTFVFFWMTGEKIKPSPTFHAFCILSGDTCLCVSELVKNLFICLFFH